MKMMRSFMLIGIVTTQLILQNIVHSEIVINEIMYKPSDDSDCKDWVELHNTQNNAVNISGWILKDDNDDHVFQFPDGSTIEAKGYLVAVESSSDFSSFYPTVTNSVGDIDYGFGRGDQVRLYDQNGTLIDSVAYSNEAPWPTTPDGSGKTLELKEPPLDNNLAENWAASEQKLGTPGRINSVTTEIEYSPAKQSPHEFRLYQNYPNPFNPTTTVVFDLPCLINVDLAVYTLTGQKLTTLVSQFLPAGHYQINWNARSEVDLPVSSGVYIYRLQVGKRVITKKMILIQ